MIFVFLLVLLLTILLFFAFFGWRKTGKIEETVSNSNISSKNDRIERISEENARILAKLEEKCPLKSKEVDSKSIEASESPEKDSEADSCEKLILEDSEDVELLDAPESPKRDSEADSCEKLILKDSEDVELLEASESLESIQSSPKSTSSCVSSAIFTDNAISPHRTPSRPTSLSGSSPVLSVASCPAPIFDFKRLTPEFVPRMMTEEFESLNKSIEKRKIDIRDLLKRIESTKRQHRRFSEHLQRVQNEHLFDY